MGLLRISGCRRLGETLPARAGAILALVSSVALASSLLGCGPKIRPYTSKEAIDALKAQSLDVKTARGRAWIAAKTPEQKISFPSVIVVDRTNAHAPMLRIEAIDPVGATHVLVILDKDQKLTWVDFDGRRIFEQKGVWHGLPLSHLPELLLGVAVLPEDGRVGSVMADSFEVRTGRAFLTYLMQWISGDRLALQGITASEKNGGNYSVHYSKFLGTPDFYLPERVELKSVARGITDLELQLDWRERRWNESVEPQVFRVPQGLHDFVREKEAAN